MEQNRSGCPRCQNHESAAIPEAPLQLILPIRHRWRFKGIPEVVRRLTSSPAMMRSGLLGLGKMLPFFQAVANGSAASTARARHLIDERLPGTPKTERPDGNVILP